MSRQTSAAPGSTRGPAAEGRPAQQALAAPDLIRGPAVPVAPVIAGPRIRSGATFIAGNPR